MWGVRTILKMNGRGQLATAATAMTGRYNFEFWINVAARDDGLVRRIVAAKYELEGMVPDDPLRELEGRRYQYLLDQAAGPR